MWSGAGTALHPLQSFILISFSFHLTSYLWTAPLALYLLISKPLRICQRKGVDIITDVWIAMTDNACYIIIIVSLPCFILSFLWQIIDPLNLCILMSISFCQAAVGPWSFPGPVDFHLFVGLYSALLWQTFNSYVSTWSFILPSKISGWLLCYLSYPFISHIHIFI